MLSVDVAAVIETAYISAAAAILLIRNIPAFRDRFLAYGSRAVKEKSATKVKNDGAARATVSKSLPAQLLDYCGSFQVPHSWFMSFYIVSVFSSMFWAYQIVLQGSVFRLVADVTPRSMQSMTTRQVVVTSALMLVQGCRRLSESLEFSKPSTSKMFIGHWLMGIFFYVTMGVAVWIEGISSLQESGIHLDQLKFVPPTPRTFISFVIFVLASGVQRDCHGYLSSLKQYSVPDHPVFQSVVCPHYLAECLIYLAMALQAAPQGALVNRTILCALVFVAVNLGVTADGTKTWYAEKFGSESVEGKWRMVPYVW